MEVYVRVREEHGSRKEEKSQGAGQATAFANTMGGHRMFAAPGLPSAGGDGTPSRNALPLKLVTAVPVALVTGRCQFPDFPYKCPFAQNVGIMLFLGDFCCLTLSKSTLKV